jgi:hypothetical protein
MGSN